MAEEEELQSLWNKAKSTQEVVNADYAVLDRARTRTTLQWIKTILWIEFWLSLVLSVPFCFWMHDNNISNGIIIFAIAVQVTYCIYYLFLIKRINLFKYDGEVLRGLKKVYRYLKVFLLHYKIVAWISVTTGFTMGYISGVESETGESITYDAAFFWGLGIGFLITMVVIGLLMQLIIYLIYGKKIRKLKGTIRALEALQ